MRRQGRAKGSGAPPHPLLHGPAGRQVRRAQGRLWYVGRRQPQWGPSRAPPQDAEVDLACEREALRWRLDPSSMLASLPCRHSSTRTAPAGNQGPRVQRGTHCAFQLQSRGGFRMHWCLRAAGLVVRGTLTLHSGPTRGGRTIQLHHRRGHSIQACQSTSRTLATGLPERVNLTQPT